MHALLPRFMARRRQAPRLPEGTRVYAIGDIHGEALLLARLLAAIERDNAERAPADTSIVLLGDVIDRGPYGAELVTALSRLADPRFRVIKGNHEAALVAAWDGDEEAVVHWLRYGGEATLAGFLGTDAPSIDSDPALLWSAIRQAVPASVVAWLRDLPLSWSLGDYFFVHAGVRPGVPLDRQRPADMLSIRAAFLDSVRHHGAFVVHGHSMSPGTIDRHDNRVGIDSGGHQTGVLTALCLEGERQWTLATAARQPCLAEEPALAA